LVKRLSTKTALGPGSLIPSTPSMRDIPPSNI
jgi:hypothetical protein